MTAQPDFRPAAPVAWPKGLKALWDGADRVIETSCAWVILSGPLAYKIKKPVNFGFLDFTSGEKRAFALQTELELNRLTAPDIYLGTERIGEEPVLKMRRFATEGVLAESAAQPGYVPDMMVMETLAGTIARFHVSAEISRDPAYADNLGYVIGSNRANMGRFEAALGAQGLAAYEALITGAKALADAHIRTRFENGWVRRCHGDLHLGNILVEAGRPVLFDCIEFNPRLMHIDTLYDLAFLLMDLGFRGQSDAANRVLNHYLECFGFLAPQDEAALYEGLSLLGLYMSVRAAVRCHVEAHLAADLVGDEGFARARAYLTRATDHLKANAPCLTLVGGLSGSGKSTHARRIAPSSGGACGAVILRSDSVRKRLMGADAFEALPPHAYSPEVNQVVVERLKVLASILLRAGQSVVVDATFRDPVLAKGLRQVAEAQAIAVKGVWLDVPRSERINRVMARRQDVSDADAAIAAAQPEQAPPEDFEVIRPSEV